MTIEFPGVLLAGGLARPMGGGDKPMRKIGGRAILERVIAPQCDGLILNANGDPARFAAFGLPVIADTVADFPGPLAGIFSGARPGGGKPARGVVGAERGSGLSVPAARPCLAATSGAHRRESATRRRGFRWAAFRDRLVGVGLREELRHALVVEDVRKIDRWTARYKLATVSWPPLDPFFNANTVEDITEAERLSALDRGLRLRPLDAAQHAKLRC